MEQKLHKKTLKYKSILKKDTGIEASCCPTTVRNVEKAILILREV